MTLRTGFHAAAAAIALVLFASGVVARRSVGVSADARAERNKTNILEFYDLMLNQQKPVEPWPNMSRPTTSSTVQACAMGATTLGCPSHANGMV